MTETVTRACWQPWDSLNIGADGQVYPCCVIHNTLAVGDLNMETIDAIVSGDRMLTLKRRILAGELSGLPCQECCNAPMKSLSIFKGEIADRFLKKPEKQQPKPDLEPVLLPVIVTSKPKKTLRQKIRNKLLRIIEQI